MTKVIQVADLFCGAGGFSSGLMAAAKSLGYCVELLAVNHWDVAIATHTANHGDVTHLCQTLDSIDPRKVVPNGRLHLMLASPECFPAGTLITTITGQVPIENIQVGDFVLTHRGRFRMVTDVMQKHSDTVVVKGHGHFGLETTEEHPFLTRTRSAKFNSEHRRYEWEFSDAEWIPAGDLMIPRTSSWHSDHIRYWATPMDIETIPIPPTGGRGMEHTPEFWWMVGRWLGDGGVRLRKSNSEVWIVCGKHEKDTLRSRLDFFAPDANSSRAKFGELRFRNRDMRTAAIFEAGHDGLARWLSDNFGRHAGGKTIPTWALTMPCAYRRHLILGYLSADGWQDDRKREGSTVSKQLAIGLRMLASSLGMHVALHRVRPHYGKIEGRTINDRVSYKMVWVDHRQRDFGKAIQGTLWQRIHSVTPGRSDIPVYNLSVEEDESYVAEGIIVHNCIHHSNARGGKPMSDQSRASAWHILRWAEALYIENILIENVPEFISWGPLGAGGRPLKSKRGELFKQIGNAVACRTAAALCHSVLA